MIWNQKVSFPFRAQTGVRAMRLSMVWTLVTWGKGAFSLRHVNQKPSDADSPSLDIHGFIQVSTCVTTCRWLCTYKFVSIMGTCRFLIAILLYEIVIYFKQVYRKSACVYRVPTYATMFVNLSPPTSMFSVLPVISRGDSWLMNDTARRQDY